jgi:Etoposide-induced protein 2.4 (EI24)
MKQLVDAFIRAVLYCLHPQVILLSFLPLIALVVTGWLLVQFFWDPAQLWVATQIDQQPVLQQIVLWLESWGFGRIRAVIGPAVVLFLTIPPLGVTVLVLVAASMVPWMVRLVARRRFPALERKKGAGIWMSVLWSLGHTVLALLALVVTLPLWIILPLAFIVPPLIWGWLTYKVMAFDVFADHASPEERRWLMNEHRLPLLTMGVVTGYLGMAPGLIWASGAMLVAMAPVVLPLALWLYTLTFVFSGLWFAHYGLSQLQAHRGIVERGRVNPSADAVVDVQAKAINEKDVP